jgi:hypothetical protein
MSFFVLLTVPSRSGGRRLSLLLIGMAMRHSLRYATELKMPIHV